MIQRIQTVYLVVAMLLSGGLAFSVNFQSLQQGTAFYLFDSFGSGNTLLTLVAVLFLLSALLALAAVLSYKKRLRQFIIGRFVLLINLILLGIFVYFSLNLSGESNISEKGIGLFIPVLNILFVSMANRAIKRDEALVKSVDRLR
ncbi:MAG: DUF4293 family protein [Lutibacter sp.]|jgi:hypothetical protein|nr:DUF4293 family protein [Lutibacter sp.]